MKLLAIATRPGTRQPMERWEEREITIENGIAGDFRSRPGSRQITVLSGNQWQKACEELGVQLDWTTRRANLLISDWQFSAKDLGKTIQIGDVKLQICAETELCAKMDQQHQGLRHALESEWRGGVCCKVIQGGLIRTHSAVHIMDNH